MFVKSAGVIAFSYIEGNDSKITFRVYFVYDITFFAIGKAGLEKDGKNCYDRTKDV